MTTPKASDFKTEDICGAVYYDPIQDFEEQSYVLRRDFRHSINELLKKHQWVGRLNIEIEELEADKPSDTKRSKLVIKFDDPKIELRVTHENINFFFDLVQESEQARRFLEELLKLVVEGLKLNELQKIGVKFRQIFRLKMNCKNYDILSNTLLPGLTEQDGRYSFLGKGIDFRRADFSWIFYRDNENLVTYVELKSPANDKNTTIWLTCDTQTRDDDVLELGKVGNLMAFFSYYEEMFNNLLEQLFSGDVLDTTRHEMMRDEWFN